jgi:hypothetical protein
MVENGNDFYEIQEWEKNYKEACFLFEEAFWDGVSPEWEIIVREIRENVFYLVVCHKKDWKEFVSSMEIEFTKKQIHWFFMPLIVALSRFPSIFDVNNNKEFDLGEILKQYDYEITNKKTENEYTFKWKCSDWVGFYHEWNNPFSPSVLITSFRL